MRAIRQRNDNSDSYWEQHQLQGKEAHADNPASLAGLTLVARLTGRKMRGKLESGFILRSLTSVNS